MAWRFSLLLGLLMLAPLPACAPPSADGYEPFTETRLQELLQRIRQPGCRWIPSSELIPLLPQELRENFTFCCTTAAARFRPGISPEFPRVILFTQ